VADDSTSFTDQAATMPLNTKPLRGVVTAAKRRSKRRQPKQLGARKQFNRALAFALVLTQGWLDQRDLGAVPLVSSHMRALLEHTQSPSQGVVVLDFCALFPVTARRVCMYFVKQLYLNQRPTQGSMDTRSACVRFVPSTFSATAAVNKSTMRKHAQALPENLAYLERLDVSGSRRLKSLNALGSLIHGGRLEYLDVSNCYALKTLHGIERVPTLKQLDASGCVTLQDISSVGQPAMRVEKLNLQKCSVLGAEQVRLLCANNGPASALISLDIGGCALVDSLRQEGNVVEELMNNCPNLDYINIADCDTLVAQVRCVPPVFSMASLADALMPLEVVKVVDTAASETVDQVVDQEQQVNRTVRRNKKTKRTKRKKKKTKSKQKKKEEEGKEERAEQVLVDSSSS
jgi:hypothetical protein